MSALLQSTIGNEEWLRANESKLLELFPAVLTHTDNVNFLRLRFQAKVLGIDYRSEAEFAKVLTVLTRVGIVEMQPPHIRRGRGLPAAA